MSEATYAQNVNNSESNTPPAPIILLPPGSSGVELQNAINKAASGDIIELSGDMKVTGGVTIPMKKTVIIRSSSGNNWQLMQTVSLNRHFAVDGELILQNITLNGGNIGGGVIVRDGGTLTIHDGVFIRMCVAGNGIIIFAENGGILAGEYQKYIVSGVYSGAGGLVGSEIPYGSGDRVLASQTTGISSEGSAYGGRITPLDSPAGMVNLFAQLIALQMTALQNRCKPCCRSQRSCSACRRFWAKQHRRPSRKLRRRTRHKQHR